MQGGGGFLLTIILLLPVFILTVYKIFRVLYSCVISFFSRLHIAQVTCRVVSITETTKLFTALVLFQASVTFTALILINSEETILTSKHPTTTLLFTMVCKTLITEEINVT